MKTVTAINNVEAQLERIAQSYEAHKANGIAFFNNKRAELIDKAIQGIISTQQAVDAVAYVQDVMLNLNVGNWLLAKQLLETKAVQGAFDASLKAEWLSGIEGYIANNY